MKTRIISLLGVILGLILSGCGGTRQEQCDNYAQVYTLYLASTIVRPVSPEETAAANVAATFLQMYCGWTNVPAQRAMNFKFEGVPLIVPKSAVE